MCRQINTSAPRLKAMPPASTEIKCLSSIISAPTNKPSTMLISVKVYNKFHTYCSLDATVTISKVVRIVSSLFCRQINISATYLWEMPESGNAQQDPLDLLLSSIVSILTKNLVQC